MQRALRPSFAQMFRKAMPRPPDRNFSKKRPGAPTRLAGDVKSVRRGRSLLANEALAAPLIRQPRIAALPSRRPLFAYPATMIVVFAYPVPMITSVMPGMRHRRLSKGAGRGTDTAARADCVRAPGGHTTAIRARSRTSVCDSERGAGCRANCLAYPHGSGRGTRWHGHDHAPLSCDSERGAGCRANRLGYPHGLGLGIRLRSAERLLLAGGAGGTRLRGRAGCQR